MSVRSLVVVSILLVCGLLTSSCSFGDLFAAQPTPTPTRTRRPTPTNAPPATETPTETATPVNTATFTPVPPTATFTQPPPTNTFTPRPPTATFTRRPPTNTPPPPPPTNTPLPAFPITFRWVNMGMSAGQLCSNVNGTFLKGFVRHKDGTPFLKSPSRPVDIHVYITGQDSGPYAKPGIQRNLVLNADGSWSYDIRKWPNDFQWNAFLTPVADDETILSDTISAVASGADKCESPDAKNIFIFDWVSTSD